MRSKAGFARSAVRGVNRMSAMCARRPVVALWYHSSLVRQNARTVVFALKLIKVTSACGCSGCKSRHNENILTTMRRTTIWNASM